MTRLAARFPGSRPNREETLYFQRVFGVGPKQIHHDFIVSHVLDLLRTHKDELLFAGGTALARTYLKSHRFSEDIDLWTNPAKPDLEVSELGTRIHETLMEGLPSRVGRPIVDVPLGKAHKDTTPSIYSFGPVSIRLQLLNSEHYPAWPVTEQEINLRYEGFPPLRLTTLTPEGFVCAKTLAWSDTTRNAPRDLYDLWALSQQGCINHEAARLYAKLGPSGKPPTRLTLPRSAPTVQEWHTALAHQCQLQVGPDEAWSTVISAWENAATTSSL